MPEIKSAEVKSNELRISAQLLGDMFTDGNEIHVRIPEGVPADAILMGVHVEEHEVIVLEFDRDVPATATVTEMRCAEAYRSHRVRELFARAQADG